MEWRPFSAIPPKDGPYLVLRPSRDLDRHSVQYFHHIDGWSNEPGITHWMSLPADPDDLEA